MKVKDIMKPLKKVPYNYTVAEVALVMTKIPTGSVVVEKNGKLVGIITERDILHKIVAKGKDPSKVLAKDVMNYPMITIDGNEDISKASEIMSKKKIRRLIVTEKGKMIGKITSRAISDNFRYLLAKSIIREKNREYYPIGRGD